MISQLKKMVRSVSENTGIEVSVYTPDGRCLLGNAGVAPPAGVDGVFGDKASGYTWFRTLGPEGYVCGIAGVGPVQKNYAFLLADLLEGAASRAARLPKGEGIRRILLGECAAADIRQYRARYSVPEGPCVAFAVEAEGKLSDVVGLLSQYAENGSDCAVPLSDKDCAFLKFVRPETEYSSPADFATFLVRSLREELGVRAQVGVGGIAARFEDAAVSYRQASAALRLGQQYGARGGVYGYRSYVLVKMLEEIPSARRAEYFSALLEGESRALLEDEDMLGTAEEFLENSLNVSETSRNLFMHRNTLMYRLDKIERMTGLDLRKFSDAVTFRVITILNRLV